MLTDAQRDRLETLAGGGVNAAAASAIRAALDEIDAARAAFLDVEAAQEESVETCTPFEPEVYTYWITFWRRRSDGQYIPGTHKLTRSTPILTCEDRELIAVEMCRDLDTIVILSNVELVKG
jgi:hypothetical protein